MSKSYSKFRKGIGQPTRPSMIHLWFTKATKPRGRRWHAGKAASAAGALISQGDETVSIRYRLSDPVGSSMPTPFGQDRPGQPAHIKRHPGWGDWLGSDDAIRGPSCERALRRSGAAPVVQNGEVSIDMRVPPRGSEEAHPNGRVQRRPAFRSVPSARAWRKGQRPPNGQLFDVPLP